MRPLSIISTRRPGVATNNTILHTTTHSYSILSTPMRPLSIISTRRPGVANKQHYLTHNNPFLLNIVYSYASSLHHIYQTAWGSNKQHYLTHSNPFLLNIVHSYASSLHHIYQTAWGSKQTTLSYTQQPILTQYCLLLCVLSPSYLPDGLE